jgi:hypothetical protein
VAAEYGAHVPLGEGVSAALGRVALVDLPALDDRRLEVVERVAEVELGDGDLVELPADGAARELGGVEVGVERTRLAPLAP